MKIARINQKNKEINLVKLIEQYLEEGKYSQPREIIKDIIVDGEFFGGSFLLGKTHRTHFSTAMEDSQVYTLQNEALKLLITENPDLLFYLMKALGNRLILVEQRLEALVFKNSRTRIIDFLRELVNRRGQRVGFEMVVRKFFTHQEIANYTATSRQTVTTVLNELKTKNILTFNRRRLLIRDMDQLKAEVA